MSTAIPLIFDPIHQVKAQYVTLSVRTAAPLEGRENLIHAILGIADELLEIYDFFHTGNTIDLNDPETRTKIIKELGDVTWFTALFAEYLYVEDDWLDGQEYFESLVANVVPEVNFLNAVNFAVATAGKCVGLAKKEYAYKKPVTVEQAGELFIRALSVVVAICNGLGVPLEEVLTRNIEKLSARYKKASFTQDEAINRDEAKE